MAADQLASPSELASLLQRDVDTSTANLLLNLATSKVQRAAGGQRIVDVTDTAVIDVPRRSACDEDWEWLDLVQFPVRSVSVVKLDGVTITDWSLRSQRLFRPAGWLLTWSPPTQVIVTSAHGYLVGSQYLELARAMTLSLAQLGYGNPDAVTSEAIDDYRVSYAEADGRMQLTESMRESIADAYGAAAYVTSSRV